MDAVKFVDDLTLTLAQLPTMEPQAAVALLEVAVRSVESVTQVCGCRLQYPLGDPIDREIARVWSCKLLDQYSSLPSVLAEVLYQVALMGTAHGGQGTHLLLG